MYSWYHVRDTCKIVWYNEGAQTLVTWYHVRDTCKTVWYNDGAQTSVTCDSSIR
jgi:hypothetical protein